MLVLTRRRNESIILTLADGSTIRVMVANVRGAKVQLAVDAPAEVRVVREELLTTER